jgi:hypothetical protein
MKMFKIDFHKIASLFLLEIREHFQSNEYLNIKGIIQFTLIVFIDILTKLPVAQNLLPCGFV